MYIPRALEGAVVEASKQFPILLITGPRQVGKTTLLRHLCGSERRYVTLDDLTLRALAQEDPRLFLQRYQAPLLIDEVQYAPNLLPYLKMLVDEAGEPGAYWLTGSQQFHLMKGVTESLAGRVGILNLLGFSRRERHGGALSIPPFLPTQACLDARPRGGEGADVTSVFKDIWRGSFPALAMGETQSWDLYYSSYLQTYIQRDVQDLAQVGDQLAFMRFMRSCAAHTGQLLNIADLARDADINQATAKQWLSVLSASFQVMVLEPYFENFSKRLVKRPKLYMLDTGMAAYLTGWSSPESLEAGAMRGAIFETFVVGEVLKSWWYKGLRPSLYFYRDKDKREIDLLLVQNDTLYPIEIKLGATPRKDWVSNFKALERSKRSIGPGAAICLAPERVPLTATVDAVPVDYI